MGTPTNEVDVPDGQTKQQPSSSRKEELVCDSV